MICSCDRLSIEYSEPGKNTKIIQKRRNIIFGRGYSHGRRVDNNVMHTAAGQITNYLRDYLHGRRVANLLFTRQIKNLFCNC